MPTHTTQYTPLEVLAFIQASYRQQQQVDEIILKGYELTFDTTLAEWMDICNLAETDHLSAYYQERFQMSVEPAQWQAVWEPVETKTLRDLCHFIAQGAEKEVIQPVKRLGQHCHTAAVFKVLLRRWQQRGIDTRSIRPSSPLEPLLKRAGMVLVDEVIFLSPDALPAITYRDNWVYRWGFRLIEAAFITVIGLAFFRTNWIALGFVIALVGSAMIRMGANMPPRQASFEGIQTVGDLVRRIPTNAAL